MNFSSLNSGQMMDTVRTFIYPLKRSFIQISVQRYNNFFNFRTKSMKKSEKQRIYTNASRILQAIPVIMTRSSLLLRAGFLLWLLLQEHRLSPMISKLHNETGKRQNGDCSILRFSAQGRGFWGGLQILMPHTVEYKIRYNASAFCKLFRFIVFMISWGVLAIQTELF